METKKTKPAPVTKGLSDAELAKKYDNGEKVNFEKVIKKAAKPTKP